MDRVTLLQYKGKTILLEDFSGLRPGPEFMQAINTAQALIARQPPRSVLALLDATGSTFNAETLSRLKDFVQANTPYIKCATVVGITGLLQVALTTLTRVAGRSFHTFPTRQAAMDFLITQ
jgi:hypothetical protein